MFGHWGDTLSISDFEFRLIATVLDLMLPKRHCQRLESGPRCLDNTTLENTGMSRKKNLSINDFVQTVEPYSIRTI